MLILKDFSKLISFDLKYSRVLIIFSILFYQSYSLSFEKDNNVNNNEFLSVTDRPQANFDYDACGYSEKEAERYNETAKILQVDYTFFMKRISRMTEGSISSLIYKRSDLGSKIEEKDREDKKSIFDIENIVSILKLVFKKAQKTMLNTHGIDKLESFLDSFEKSKQDYFIDFHKNIIKLLYDVSGNSLFYKQKVKRMQGKQLTPPVFSDAEIINEGTNQFLLTIFWTFFIYDKVKDVFGDFAIDTIGDDLLFIFFYPVFIKNTNETYKKIRFEETLQKCFTPFLKMNEGFLNLFGQAQYPQAINEDMAYLQSLQRYIFMNLLLNKENIDEVEEIKNIFDELAKISQEIDLLQKGISLKKRKWLDGLSNMFGVSGLPIQEYMKDHIPIDLFPPFSGIKSSKGVYSVFSLLMFQQRAWGMPLSFLTNTLQETTNFFTWDNPLIRSIPVFSVFPISLIPKKTIPDGALLYLASKNLSVGSGGEEKILEAYQKVLNKDTHLFTISDTIEKYNNLPSFLGNIINKCHIPVIPLPFYYKTIRLGTVLGVGAHMLSGTASLVSQYYSIKSILSVTNSVINYFSYFTLLTALIKKSKNLYNSLKKLYKKNSIPEMFIVPEVQMMGSVFKGSNQKNSVINKILVQENNNKIKKSLNILVNFFAPGKMAHFYFNDLYESQELDILKNFIGSIDLTFAKIGLLSMQAVDKNFIFSIPHIKNPKKDKSVAFLAKHMWYPMLPGDPVKNNIVLAGCHKNMMLVSPVAGGKTVLLSTLLTLLYMSNIGIVPASYFEFSYFTNVVDHLEHPYDIGGGLSQHLAERKSMDIVKSTLEESQANKKNIVIIDEIFKGTIHALAVREANLDLPPILKKENTITIVTTHLPEITKITENKENNIDLFYLVVEHFAGVFKKTYQLKPDDENNWWIRNLDLGFSYQASLKN